MLTGMFWLFSDHFLNENLLSCRIRTPVQFFSLLRKWVHNNDKIKTTCRWLVQIIDEPQHDKTNIMTCAPSKDSDQPGPPPSLIRVFSVQADLRLCWAHMPFCWFCRAAAQITLRSKHTLGTQVPNISLVWEAIFEPRHDKTNKVIVRPAKTQISLDIHPVWSGSSLFA